METVYAVSSVVVVLQNANIYSTMDMINLRNTLQLLRCVTAYCMLTLALTSSLVALETAYTMSGLKVAACTMKNG